MEKNHAKGHKMNTKQHRGERNEANLKANNFIDSGEPLLREKSRIISPKLTKLLPVYNRLKTNMQYCYQ